VEFVMMIVIAIVGLMLIHYISEGFKADRRDAIKEETCTTEEIVVAGDYVMGHPKINIATNVWIAATETDFILFEKKKRIGEIPKKAVKQIAVEDRSSLQQRLTATRLVTLGVFALAAPKKKKIEEYFLVISWVDEKRMEHNTTFRGGNAEGTNGRRNLLLNYL